MGNVPYRKPNILRDAVLLVDSVVVSNAPTICQVTSGSINLSESKNTIEILKYNLHDMIIYYSLITFVYTQLVIL